MNPFSAGDIVHLKSGGPNMTVARVLEDANRTGLLVECVWFDEALDLHRVKVETQALLAGPR